MSASPYCLSCEQRVDPDLGVLVVLDGASRVGRERDGAWTCGRRECLAWLARAAEEEECELLRPQGIFEVGHRSDGLPSWVVWISREKRRREEEASGLFAAIYQPFTVTAR